MKKGKWRSRWNARMKTYIEKSPEWQNLKEHGIAPEKPEPPPPVMIVLTILCSLFGVYVITCCVIAQVRGMQFESVFLGKGWKPASSQSDVDPNRISDERNQENLKSMVYGRDVYIPTWIMPGYWDNQVKWDFYPEYDLMIRFSRDTNTPPTKDTILFYQSRSSKVTLDMEADDYVIREQDGIVYTYAERTVNRVNYQWVSWEQDGRRMWITYQWLYKQDILAREDLLRMAMSMEYCGDKEYDNAWPPKVGSVL